MIIKTKFFGEISIDSEEIINFKEGILGFPEDKRYVLLRDPRKENSVFLFLQSVDNFWLCFVVVEPEKFFTNYNPVFPWSDLRDIEVVDKSQMKVLCIVTIPPENPKDMTVNLQAPVVINVEKKLGKQIIALNEYNIRERLIS